MAAMVLHLIGELPSDVPLQDSATTALRACKNRVGKQAHEPHDGTQIGGRRALLLLKCKTLTYSPFLYKVIPHKLTFLIRVLKVTFLIWCLLVKEVFELNAGKRSAYQSGGVGVVDEPILACASRAFVCQGNTTIVFMVR